MSLSEKFRCNFRPISIEKCSEISPNFGAKIHWQTSRKSLPKLWPKRRLRCRTSERGHERDPCGDQGRVYASDDRRAPNVKAPDRKVVACNFRVSTKLVPEGAKAYVERTNPGGGHDRIWVQARARGGRWIRRVEAMHRLHNFRLKTLPPEHPAYNWEHLEPGTEETVAKLNAASDRETR